MTPPTNPVGASGGADAGGKNTAPMTDVAAIWGLRLVETSLMTVGPFEDWSQVRSPGRARRRRAKHRQRIRYYHKPDPQVMIDKANGVIYGHPATLAHLRSALMKDKAL